MFTSKAMNSEYITPGPRPYGSVAVTIEYGCYIKCVESIPIVIRGNSTEYVFYMGFWLNPRFTTTQTDAKENYRE